MRTDFFKVLCLVLAVCVLFATSSMSVVAMEETTSELSQIKLSAESVMMDGVGEKTVTVSLVATADLMCYSMEGFWSLHEQADSNYFTLNKLALGSTVVADSMDDYVSVTTGKVIWTDDDFNSEVTAENGNLMIATYKVAANTPAGDYKLTYTSKVFTGASGDPNETETVFEVTVHVHNDSNADQDHICDASDCEVVLNACTFAEATCDTAKTCTVCGATEGEALGHAWGEPTKFVDNNDGTHTAHYACANNTEHVKTETAEHAYVDGVCVCGASNITTGLLGDVNLDGAVDMEDVVSLMRHTLQAEIITDAQALANGEVTGDTALDMNDVVKLMQYVLKAIDSLE